MMEVSWGSVEVMTIDPDANSWQNFHLATSPSTDVNVMKADVVPLQISYHYPK